MYTSAIAYLVVATDAIAPSTQEIWIFDIKVDRQALDMRTPALCYRGVSAAAASYAHLLCPPQPIRLVEAGLGRERFWGLCSSFASLRMTTVTSEYVD